MASTNTDTISNLNCLTKTCKDGEAGFKTAAEHTQDPDLKALFMNYAQQRAGFANDLRNAVLRLGGAAEDGGSITGAMHRGWMQLKSTVTGDSDAALIHEAERGEDVAKAAYQKALDLDLPLDVQGIVQRQFIQVKEAHDRIRTLERQLELEPRKV